MTTPSLQIAVPTVLPGRYAEYVCGLRLDVETYASATRRIVTWAQRRESRYVCVANVHMTMEAAESPSFQKVVNGADMVTTDGMPLVWTLKSRGFSGASRVYGPDLMLSVCAAAVTAGVSVAFFGGSESTLEKLGAALRLKFPALQIAAAISPPFRPLSAEENKNHLAQLTQCGAGIVFVGLGCPKQERWMAACAGQVPAVFVGVGAAFNFHAGEVRQAPGWLQRIGMEWAFRLAAEPRRLWRRYLHTNPRFVRALAREEWRRRRS